MLLKLVNFRLKRYLIFHAWKEILGLIVLQFRLFKFLQRENLWNSKVSSRKFTVFSLENSEEKKHSH